VIRYSRKDIENEQSELKFLDEVPQNKQFEIFLLVGTEKLGTIKVRKSNSVIIGCSCDKDTADIIIKQILNKV
jgi:hypothetical protein